MASRLISCLIKTMKTVHKCLDRFISMPKNPQSVAGHDVMTRSEMNGGQKRGTKVLVNLKGIWIYFDPVENSLFRTMKLSFAPFSLKAFESLKSVQIAPTM